jgi:hypothetical protein
VLQVRDERMTLWKPNRSGGAGPRSRGGEDLLSTECDPAAE